MRIGAWDGIEAFLPLCGRMPGDMVYFVCDVSNNCPIAMCLMCIKVP